MIKVYCSKWANYEQLVLRWIVSHNLWQSQQEQDSSLFFIYAFALKFNTFFCKTQKQFSIYQIYNFTIVLQWSRILQS